MSVPSHQTNQPQNTGRGSIFVLCECGFGRCTISVADGIVFPVAVTGTTGTTIDLAVPNGETDRFPDEDIDWVLFTAIDANEHVVDAGGGLL